MRSRLTDFRDLEVWQAARALTTTVYALTRDFPKEETFGLASQMRRAAVSVATNIAEGAGRLGVSEYRRYISIALGSAAELRALLILSADLGLVAEDRVAGLHENLDTIGRMLNGLVKSLSPHER